MNAMDLHKDALVIDALNASKWNRDVFEDMHRGGITAVNCTCCIWEDFRDTMRNITQWKRWFIEHDDILLQVYTTADVRRAKTEGKVGIILGWQNTSGINDQISYLQIFKELGVGVMQLTYNTQNLVGSGLSESRDGGLSDFGREVVEEMNRVGILIDLSHVGRKTSEDAILQSRKPVAYTHASPAALKVNWRNKTDAQIRFIADHGGIVGVSLFPPFLCRGNESTIDDYIDAIEHTINVAGEDHVALGTDFTQGQEPAFMEWAVRDKGYARQLLKPDVDFIFPAGIRTNGDFPNLTAALGRRDWPESRIRKVLGENLLRLLEEVWGHNTEGHNS